MTAKLLKCNVVTFGDAKVGILQERVLLFLLPKCDNFFFLQKVPLAIFLLNPEVP